MGIFRQLSVLEEREGIKEKLEFKVTTNEDFGDGKQRRIELLIPFRAGGSEDRIGDLQLVTFRCDDVYATAEVLKSRGVKLAAEPEKEFGERWRNSKTQMVTILSFRASSD
jgi:hypothetical protein